jgi:hypothetical protein
MNKINIFEFKKQNYDNFLGELDVMQKADRERRQKELLNIPVSF